MQLEEKAFLATMGEPMKNVTANPEAVVDIWPYVGQIPKADMRGFVIQDGVVEYVYRTPDGRFDHVLIPTLTQNVYLVLVISRTQATVYGHLPLNLNEKYGLPTPGHSRRGV